MSMIQIGLLGIVGVLLASQFKQEKAEIAVYISVAISLLIFFALLENLRVFVDMLREIMGYIEIDHSYLITLMKMLGITYVAEFSSGLCKDAGYQSIASHIEMFGKLTVFVLSLPVLLALLRTIQEFLK